MAASVSSIERQSSLGTPQPAPNPTQTSAPSNPFKDRSNQILEEQKKRRRRLSDQFFSEVPTVNDALGLGD